MKEDTISTNCHNFLFFGLRDSRHNLKHESTKKTCYIPLINVTHQNICNVLFVHVADQTFFQITQGPGSVGGSMS